MAMCLAMAGVYGVIAYMVGQRSSEIGVRIALGASSGDVLWLVLWEGLVLACVGLAAGLAGAVAVRRLLTRMLFEVKPGDPMTYAGVTLMIGLVALAARFVPGLRTPEVDPVIALRV